jgi:hypothetical protein
MFEKCPKIRKKYAENVEKFFSSSSHEPLLFRVWLAEGTFKGTGS